MLVAFGSGIINDGLYDFRVLGKGLREFVYGFLREAKLVNIRFNHLALRIFAYLEWKPSFLFHGSKYRGSV